VKYGAEVLYKNVSRKNDLRENRRSESHKLLQGVNIPMLAFSTLFVQFG
jgi:hypothetical protein